MVNALLAQKPLMHDNLHVKGITKVNAKIYVKPNDRSTVLEEAPEFSLFYLFRTNGGSETKNGFYRVGTNNKKEFGWIQQHQIQKWDHRICLGFTPLVGRTPSLLYRSQQDIEKMLNQQEARPIAEEPNSTFQFSKTMLMPVLGQTNIRTGRKKNSVFEIAYIGKEESYKASASTPIRSREHKKMLLDLMFVVDATSSMEPYIQNIKTVIRDLANRFSDDSQLGVRYGIWAYRDFIPDKQDRIGFVENQYSELIDDKDKILNILDAEVKVSPVQSEDIQEAAFDAIFPAITETNWVNNTSSLRLIVWISDASAHPAGHPKNRFNYGLDQIMRQASANRVRFLVLKIKSGKPDDLLHSQQGQKLAQGISQGDQGIYQEIELAETSKMTSAYQQKLRKTISEEVKTLVLLQEVQSKNKSISQLPIEKRTIVLKNLASNDGASEFQFSKGWVSELNNEGIAQVTPYVFMTYEELSMLNFNLNMAIGLSESPDQQLYNTYLQVLNSSSGDAYQDGQKINEYLKKRFALPRLSRLLNFSYDDIMNWGERKRKSVLASITQKKNRLEKFMANPSNWVIGENGNFGYTFLPLSYLP